MLVLDAPVLAQRLAARRAVPDRPEQAANDRFVGPEDAPSLVASIDELLRARSSARRFDADRPLEELVGALGALLPPILELGTAGEDVT